MQSGASQQLRHNKDLSYQKVNGKKDDWKTDHLKNRCHKKFLSNNAVEFSTDYAVLLRDEKHKF